MYLYQKGNVFLLHRGHEVHFFTGATQAEAIRLPDARPIRYPQGEPLPFLKTAILNDGFRPTPFIREGMHRFLKLLGDGTPFRSPGC